MEQCPNKNNNQSCQKMFDPWYSKKQGKPQQYPYKSCYSCRQLAKTLYTPVQNPPDTAFPYSNQPVHQVSEQNSSTGQLEGNNGTPSEGKLIMDRLDAMAEYLKRKLGD